MAKVRSLRGVEPAELVDGLLADIEVIEGFLYAVRYQDGDLDWGCSNMSLAGMTELGAVLQAAVMSRTQSAIADQEEDE